MKKLTLKGEKCQVLLIKSDIIVVAATKCQQDSHYNK